MGYKHRSPGTWLPPSRLCDIQWDYKSVCSYSNAKHLSNPILQNRYIKPFNKSVRNYAFYFDSKALKTLPLISESSGFQAHYLFTFLADDIIAC